MEYGLDYPLYIVPPEKVNLTATQFDSLSYMGLSSALIAFTFLIEKKETEYQVFTQEWIANRFVGKNRCKGIKFWTYSEAEMGRADVPFDHPMAKTIEKYLSHFIMES